MPLQLGMASSHAPSLFFGSYEGWEFIHHMGHDGHPMPPEIALEDREEIERRIPRSRANFDVLRQQLAAYNPDALIIVGGDQAEWFDAANMPSLLIYTGEEDLWGTKITDVDLDKELEVGFAPPGHPRYKVDFKADSELSQELLKGLVSEGFDIAISKKMKPQGTMYMGPPHQGMPHAFAFPAPHILPRPDLPIVALFIITTEDTPALLTGQRCLELGRAIAKVCEKSDKRIAIYGSGGMSHDPFLLRQAWVDEPLDNWFMDQLTGGTMDNLKAMFSFHSENFRVGTGELRTWITVAGAVDYMKPGHKAVKVDYFPARKVDTGSGWVDWPPIEGARVSKRAPASAH